MSLSANRFKEFFEALYNREPYSWQERLAALAVEGNWPPAIDLPTGSGKTACIDIAVFALACQTARELGKRTAPRRIFFCVNRRVIVDEAHQRTQGIAKQLWEAEKDEDCPEVLRSVAAALRTLAGTTKDDNVPPLDVLELRGGIYRDNRWARSATQPTVICTTIDQLGSRLLFRGYGVSPSAAPLQAALIAYDSLVFLDEAHISRPFSESLAQVRRYLDPEKWAAQSIGAKRMKFVPMTATPPAGANTDDMIRLDDDDRANKSLAARLKAKKPAQLLLVTDVPKTIIAQARTHAKAPQAIGIIVNRIATAKEIHEALRKEFPGPVELVIGSMRPIDRDEQSKRLGPLVGPNRKIFDKTSFTVATQCLEVGADYDFDVLITECASLDALRQRFGRLNRGGRSIEASAVIVAKSKEIGSEPLDDDKPLDPIYGNALSRTWNWLLSHSTAISPENRSIDFGIDAFNALIDKHTEDRRIPEDLLAPSAKLHAPVMLPAYVDFWCQTSPRPVPDPDVALFVHGQQSAEPDVQVCWRADLIADGQMTPEHWCDIVALVPPTTAECMSVPISRLRRWLLRERDLLAEDCDLLEVGRQVEDDDRKTRDRNSTPPSLRTKGVLWRGTKESKLIASTNDLRPGDTLVLPVDEKSENEWNILGHIPPADSSAEGLDDDTHVAQRNTTTETSQIDIAEAAFKAVRDKAVLRLHPSLLASLPEHARIKELVERAGNREEPLTRTDLQDLMSELKVSLVEGGERLQSILKDLINPRFGLIREFYPDRRGVVFTSRRRLETPKSWFLPSLDDGEDDSSRLGREQPVTLVDHTRHVEDTLEHTVDLLPTSVSCAAFMLTAKLHDWGKADGRFQAMLLRTDPSDAAQYPTLLAKSDGMAMTPRERSDARKRAELPVGYRHELLSVQLAERSDELPFDAAERDLILHLIAAHHGYARPFAPFALDDDDKPPPDVKFGGVALSSEHRKKRPPHRLDSGITERFWSLTHRFGWWGLAYLESLLRLADQQASANEDLGKYDKATSLQSEEGMSVPTSNPEGSAKPLASLLLSGLDGANPLGFLAALGTLQTLTSTFPQAGITMSWIETARGYRPQIYGTGGTLTSISLQIANHLKCPFQPTAGAERDREAAQDRFDKTKKKLAKAVEELKKKGLKGNERKVAVALEIEPLRAVFADLRNAWLRTLPGCVSSPELSLGKHLNAKCNELREASLEALKDANIGQRELVDFFASFGSDACSGKDNVQMQATPFCFITGSGHQYFLDTVRQLTAKLDAERFEEALRKEAEATDEKLSMRWDPFEDRRYAHMWSDPTASDNVAKTNWALNLLAYRGLLLIPSVPTAKGLRTIGWPSRCQSHWTWPIWDCPLTATVVRSLLAHGLFATDDPESTVVADLGVTALYRSSRIQVGNPPLHKVNFTPALRIA